MDEYINRDAVLDLFGEVPAYTGYETYPVRVHTFICEIVPLIKDAIRKIPSEDVAPVRHGSIIETIEDGRMKRVFSCCGADFTEMTCWMTPKYCPNCGSRMDGDDDK